MKHTTIKDVAEQAGVSVTTVSLVLNDKSENISHATKQRVKRAAEALNYSPDLLARNLRSSNNNMLILLVPSLMNSFFSKIAESAIACAQRHGYYLFVMSFSGGQTEAERISGLLRGSIYAGILIVSRNFRSIEKELSNEEFPIPYVLIDECFFEAKDTTLVGGNNKEGGKIIAEYLIRNGHRNFACLTGPKNSPNTQARLEGFLSALDENDCTMDPNSIFEGDYTASSGYAFAKEIIETKASALFAFNDLMAMGCIKKLKELGLSIPEDISIVGYDNIFLNQYFPFQLTSVDQNAEEIGKLGVETLLKKIVKQEVIKSSILVQPNLVIGDTVRNNVY